MLSNKHKIEVRLYDASEREIKSSQVRFQSLVPRKMTNCGCSHSVLCTIHTSLSSLKLGPWEMEKVSSASEHPCILWALCSLGQGEGKPKLIILHIPSPSYFASGYVPIPSPAKAATEFPYHLPAWIYFSFFLKCCAKISFRDESASLNWYDQNLSHF